MRKKSVAWELEPVSLLIRGAQPRSRMHLVLGPSPRCAAVGGGPPKLRPPPQDEIITSPANLPAAAGTAKR